MTRLEFHQDNDIAIRSKILAKHRAKKCKFSNMIFTAKSINLLLVEFIRYITHVIIIA